MRRLATLPLAALIIAAFPSTAGATAVTLQNATATFEQNACNGLWPISAAIDGSLSTGFGSGWAIARNSGGTCSYSTATNPETAWFETVGLQGSAAGTVYTFTLSQLFGNFHTLGLFELSYTTSPQAGGFNDSNATWIPLTLATAVATNGATLTIVGTNGVLASGTNPLTSVYTITTASLSVTGITGFRIGALSDASQPSTLGPGRQPLNGNFVLTEFQVDAQNNVVPEPGTMALIGLGLAAIVARRRFQRP